MSMDAKGHILVIEPNDITRMLIVRILASKGHQTYDAATADAAVPLLGKTLSMVVMDIDGGNVDNIGLLQKIQLMHARLPMVVITDEEDEAAVRKRIDVKHVQIVHKPVKPEELIENIEKSLAYVTAQDDTVVALRAKHEGFMRRAIDLSQMKMDENCGGPFGCVIVRNGEIIGEGWNQVTSTNDPTAHAEVVAIRNASAAIGNFSLEGCTLYTSCEPCPMCLAAIYWARIEKVYFGNTRQDAEFIGFDDDFIYREFAQTEDRRSLPAKMLLREEAQIVFANWMKKDDKAAY